MSSHFYNLFPLAQQDRMQDLFRAFRATQAREGMEQVFYGLLILIGIAALILFLSQVVKSWKRRIGHASPLGLFLDLCRAHKLKWSQRWLLWRLARLEQLDEPARLFLEPQWYASYSMPAALSQRARDLINLRNRLFVDLGASLKSFDNEQAGQPEPIEPVGAALPVLNTAPQLDIPPWQSSPFPPSLPPFSNVPNGPQV